eukprot:11744749-Alexandrium_andersonii.AAC.1
MGPPKRQVCRSVATRKASVRQQGRCISCPRLPSMARAHLPDSASAQLGPATCDSAANPCE